MSDQEIVVVITQNEIVAELTMQSVAAQPVVYEVVAEQIVQEVLVSFPGPQGPPGPPGADGIPGGSFTVSFVDANFVSVPHNLGYKPNATVVVGGEEVDVDVIHVSDDLLTVGWNSALLTGEVVCS